jgi:hypothetical protein
MHQLPPLCICLTIEQALTAMWSQQRMHPSPKLLTNRAIHVWVESGGEEPKWILRLGREVDGGRWKCKECDGSQGRATLQA